MQLKNYLIVQDYDKAFHVWTKKEYENYIAGCVEVGAGSAYKLVTHFDGTEDLLNESLSPEYVSDLKELDASFDYLCKMDGVKDAGHRWIAFSDKWEAFKKKYFGVASTTTQTSSPPPG